MLAVMKRESLHTIGSRVCNTPRRRGEDVALLGVAMTGSSTTDEMDPIRHGRFCLLQSIITRMCSIYT